MEKLREAEVAIAIREAKAAAVKADEHLAAIMAEKQATCMHRIVSEMPYTRSGMSARRICNHCLTEEQGSHWSGGSVWSKENHGGPPILGNVEGRLVLPVDSDTFYNIRRMK